MKTILASASPRRRELLTQMGIIFEVRPAKSKEIITKVVPEEIVKELAYQKAAEIAEQVLEEEKEYSGTIRIIGSDTVVAYKDQIFGKPADEADALRMLTILQGETHQVYTGVCVIDMFMGAEQPPVLETVPEQEVISRTDSKRMVKLFAEKTDVSMYPASEQELLHYIKTGEPMDKAGAYAIQGISARFIKEIHGDYFNVVGLPVARLYQECYKQEPSYI